MCFLCTLLVSAKLNPFIWLKGPVLSVKTQICCFSNFTCKYSRNHSSYCLYLMCSLFDFIRRWHDYKCVKMYRAPFLYLPGAPNSLSLPRPLRHSIRSKFCLQQRKTIVVCIFDGWMHFFGLQKLNTHLLPL